MIRKETTMYALVAVGALSLPLLAQTGNTGGKGTPPQPGQTGQPQPGQLGRAPGGTMSQELTLQRGDKLIGMEVKDSAGAKIGRIDDLVLLADGSIAYVVIANDEGALYPVPWRVVRLQQPTPDVPGGVGTGATLSRDGHIVLVGIDSARWKTAPHFDRMSWPKDNERGVFTEADTFFGSADVHGRPDTGSRPVDASAPKPPVSTTYFRVTKLQNQPVTDASGQPIGKFGTFVFDPHAGRVNYTSVSLDSSAEGSGRVVAMPWGTLRASRMDEKDRFTLTTPSEKLRSAPQFISGDESWKQMSDPKWVNEMYTYYSVRPYWHTTSNTGTGAGTPPAKPSSPPEKPAAPDKPAGGGI